MKRISIAGIVFAALAIGCYAYVINLVKSEKAIVESELGKTIVFESDTVIVIDYSYFSCSYILSNGKEIHPKLLKKLKQVK